MTLRYLATWLLVGAVSGGLAPGAVIAQQAASDIWTAPQTADGHPDLQGVWDFGTITPLERPVELGDKAVLTDEEAAAFEQQTAESRVDAPPPPGSVGGYNQYWFDRGTRVVEDQRTSLIMDPPDGRLPALQPGAIRSVSVNRTEEEYPGDIRPVRLRSGGIGRNGAEGPEDRALAERCLLGFNSGPPTISSAYNNNIQIFQTENDVVILHEMVHDARLVTLDDRPRLPDNIRQWMGDPHGYWDGDTLVVESRNFTDKTASLNPAPGTALGSGLTLHLTERFTRVDADTLLYEFTIDDPATFTKPITAASTMARNQNTLFEYACHEGNYGLLNVLRGAREAEASAAASGQQ